MICCAVELNHGILSPVSSLAVKSGSQSCQIEFYNLCIGVNLEQGDVDLPVIAYTSDESNSWPYPWVWQRVRRAWHSPFPNSEVAISYLGLVNVDNAHSGTEQLDHIERELLTKYKTPVSVAREWNALDLFEAHA